MALPLLVLVLLLGLFRAPLWAMVQAWSQPEYGHAYFIPPLAALIAWQCAAGLPPGVIRPAPSGLALLALGLLVNLAGALSTLYPLQQYAFLICLAGLCATALGWRASARLAPALVFLVFMIPLPPFLFINLSAKLQLLSSALGVSFIRAFSIPVFAEGNVIDLGGYRLQVAEACSGLRYLFPLVSFGFLMGFLYRGPNWQRALLLLSAIPIAILMNSLRIGVVGLTVTHWGTAAAEGFLHLFEGWTVFLLCLGLLFGSAALLWRAGGGRGSFADMLLIELPRATALAPLGPRLRHLARAPLLLVAALALAGAAASGSVLERQGEIIPPHPALALFPTSLPPWRGETVPLEPAIVKQLAADDYLHRNYVGAPSPAPVNLYIIYFASQKNGTGLHSPQNCLPAGGWEIESIRQQSLLGGPAPAVNRVLIRKGTARALVYYWFHQRNRNLTRELAVKWYILADAITKRRSDGSMIRLVTPLLPGEEEARGDARLQAFSREIAGPLAAALGN